MFKKLAKQGQSGSGSAPPPSSPPPGYTPSNTNSTPMVPPPDTMPPPPPMMPTAPPPMPTSMVPPPQQMTASQQYQIPSSALQVLAGYDILFVIDDSTSMNIGSRIDEVKETIEMMAKLACEFDSDGVEFCFLNQRELECNINNPAEVQPLFSRVEWEGLTPTGTRLQQIVSNYKTLRSRNPNTKPLSIIVITDGAATDREVLESVIVDSARSLPQGSIAFQFFQVGNDQKSREFLTHLDDNIKHKYQIPDIVDCVSSRSGMRLKDIVRKALIGALDSKADAMYSF